MDDNFQINCKYCREVVSTNAYFCSNCGKILREKTTISRQFVVYFISLFVPPFGLLYVWKYLKQAGDKAKWIGITAFILTVISIVFSALFFQMLMSQVTQSLNLIGI